MPTFVFPRPVVLPDPPTVCLVPRWPAVVATPATAAPIDLVGIASDAQGGSFVLTIERVAVGSNYHRALRLAHVDAAGVLNATLSLHVSTFAASVRHVYYASIGPLGPGQCVVAWGETATAFRAEGFDTNLKRIFSNSLATAVDVPRLPTIAARGSEAVVAFFHFTAGARRLQVRLIGTSGAIGWTGLGWPAAASGFRDLEFPQIATAATGQLDVHWQEPTTGQFTNFMHRIAANGTLLGVPVPATASTESWSVRGIQRATTDGDGGSYVAIVDSAGALSIVRVAQPRPGVFTRFPAWVVRIATLINPFAYSIAADGRGGLFVAYIDASGLVTAKRLDSQGANVWASFGNVFIANLPASFFAGAPFDFFAHSIAVTGNGADGATVFYRDVGGPGHAPLSFACIDPIGRIGTFGASVSAARFPAQTLCTGSDPSSALVAWQDHSAMTTSTTNVIVQKVGCCPDRSGRLLTPPNWDLPEFPVDYPPFPGHLSVVLTGRSGEQGSYGFMPLSELASIPGVVLPGGLVNPKMPRPDWIRISFRGLRLDFTIELFTQKGKSVARAKPPRRSDSESIADTQQLEFRPTHPGLYILGIGYEGSALAPGERHLLGIDVDFGADPPRRRKATRRRVAAKSRRRKRK